MSIVRARRAAFWARIGRMVKGFGRAFAIKEISKHVDSPEIARKIVKRYISNQRVRA